MPRLRPPSFRRQLIACPGEHQHPLVIRDASPLLVDHAFIAIYHWADMDIRDRPVHSIETCASLEMILEWFAQTGSIGN